MVNDAKVTGNDNGALTEAQKDAAAIRQTYEQKGAREAWDMLKEDRANAKNFSAADQDIWEKEMVKQLSSKDGNKDLLPNLTIAYLEANKDALGDSHGYIDKREVRYTKDALNNDLKMEKVAGKDLGTDDVEAMLANKAYDLIQKDAFKKINQYDDLTTTPIFGHSRNEDEAVYTKYLGKYLDGQGEQAKKEFGFQQLRDENKRIAEALSKDSKLFNSIDEANADDKRDGKITLSEVQKFINHINNSPEFGSQFSNDERLLVNALQRSLRNGQNYKDEKNTFSALDYSNDFDPTITKESIEKTTGHKFGEPSQAELAARLQKETADKEKAEKKDDKTVEHTAEKKEDKKTEKKEDKKEDKKVENKDEKKEDKKSDIVDENQLINDGIQKVGEGPWQVAARLLRGVHDTAAQTALTNILKQQLIEDTDSKTYAEAVSKMKVGHQFLTCEGLEHLREKIAASKNPTLIKVFGKTAAQLKQADEDAKNLHETLEYDE